MRLSCKKAFFLLAAATLACGEPLSPRSVSGTYVLVSINGEPLPYAVLQPIPEETITVLLGTVSLDIDGNAIAVERRRENPQNNPTETTYSRASQYELNGRAISFGFPQRCPPNALCIGIVEGVFMGSDLNVKVPSGFPDQPLTYQYRYVTPL